MPDADRPPAYTPRALSRLVLSSLAAGVSSAAAELVATRYDVHNGSGGRAGEARMLARSARELVTAAVVFERERGTSWSEIAPHLGMTPAEAEHRFTPAVAAWREALAEPLGRAPDTGRLFHRLPVAAEDPQRHAERLDFWAAWRLGYQDKHAVTDGLDGDDLPPDTEGRDLDGWMPEHHLDAFLGLTASYANAPSPDAADRAALARALPDTDDEAPDRWHTHAVTGLTATLHVCMARHSAGHGVSVRVVGAKSGDLRLRVATMLDAFARCA